MLKKFLIGTFVAVALLAGASAANAAYDFGPTTLKVGSSGQYVMNLQTVVGATADGKFGPMTKAAVMAWQASNGLVADGLVGPATKNALNAGTFTGGVTYPAGCTSAVGYSSTTGQKCDSTVASGLPAGCMSTVGYSSTTGAKCDGSTTGPVVTGPLQGGAGDINVSDTSSDVESDVKEGDNNVKVLGFRVEADGSDVEITNLKVTLDNIGTGSTRPERYMSEVSVWMGSTEVGSADVEDFSKNGIVYTKNISLSGAVIREGEKPYFYVAVSAISNIDSTDLTNEDWRVDASDIRFMDATGMVLTDTTNITATKPDFVSLANSGDVKLNITKGSDSPAAGNVKVSSTGSTSDVLMNQFKLKATGTDMTISKIVLTTTGTGAKANESASELRIKVGSDVIATNDAALPDATAATDVDFTLDDELVIEEGDTVTFNVYAKINKIGVVSFAQGEALKVDYKSVTVEDENGDAVAAGSISGAAIGETQTFFSEGINASGFTSSVVTTTATTGITTKQTYTISYDLTAFGKTYYIPKTLERNVAATPSLASTDNGTTGLGYSIETSAGAMAEVVVVASSHSALTSNASTVSNYFEIADGETKTFTATIEITPGTGAGFYHVQLGQARYDLDQTAVGTDESVYIFAPAQNFETADRSLPAA